MCMSRAFAIRLRLQTHVGSFRIPVLYAARDECHYGVCHFQPFG